MFYDMGWAEGWVVVAKHFPGYCSKVLMDVGNPW